MSSPQEQFEELISALSKRVGMTLPIENGMCSLENDLGETVINVELPDSGDQVLLHRMLLPVPSDTGTREARAMQLLSLNSHQMQMAGHWFCVDSDGQAVHLMTSRPLDGFGIDEFEKWAETFIDLGVDLAETLKEEEIELTSSESIPSQVVMP